MENKEVNTIQIKDKALKSGFTQMPRVVLKAKGLSMQSKTLYSLLLDYAWQEGSCFPGQDRLAEDLNVHKNTILKYLHELRDYKLISWIQRGLNKTNIYYIESLNFLYERNVIKSLESQSSVTPESQAYRNPEFQEGVNIIETELIDPDKYTQTLTYGSKKEFNPEDFDSEAVFIANELNDLKSLPYYQKVITQRNNRELTDAQIQRALTTVRDKLAVDKADNTNFWKKPGAMFVKALKKTLKEESKKTIDLTKLVESKQIEPMKRPDLLGLKSKALEQLKSEEIDSS